MAMSKLQKGVLKGPFLFSCNTRDSENMIRFVERGSDEPIGQAMPMATMKAG